MKNEKPGSGKSDYTREMANKLADFLTANPEHAKMPISSIGGKDSPNLLPFEGLPRKDARGGTDIVVPRSFHDNKFETSCLEASLKSDKDKHPKNFFVVDQSGAAPSRETIEKIRELGIPGSGKMNIISPLDGEKLFDISKERDMLSAVIPASMLESFEENCVAAALSKMEKPEQVTTSSSEPSPLG